MHELTDKERGGREGREGREGGEGRGGGREGELILLWLTSVSTTALPQPLPTFPCIEPKCWSDSPDKGRWSQTEGMGHANLALSGPRGYPFPHPRPRRGGWALPTRHGA